MDPFDSNIARIPGIFQAAPTWTFEAYMRKLFAGLVNAILALTVLVGLAIAAFRLEVDGVRVPPSAVRRPKGSLEMLSMVVHSRAARRFALINIAQQTGDPIR